MQNRTEIWDQPGEQSSQYDSSPSFDLPPQAALEPVAGLIEILDYPQHRLYRAQAWFSKHPVTTDGLALAPLVQRFPNVPLEACGPITLDDREYDRKTIDVGKSLELQGAGQALVLHRVAGDYGPEYEVPGSVGSKVRDRVGIVGTRYAPYPTELGYITDGEEFTLVAPGAEGVQPFQVQFRGAPHLQLDSHKDDDDDTLFLREHEGLELRWTVSERSRPADFLAVLINGEILCKFENDGEAYIERETFPKQSAYAARVGSNSVGIMFYSADLVKIPGLPGRTAVLSVSRWDFAINPSF